MVNPINRIKVLLVMMIFYQVIYCQDTLKAEGFMIYDVGQHYFVPIDGNFKKMKNIKFENYHFLTGFFLSLTYDYFDEMTVTKGVKYCVYPNLIEKFKYIYVLPCKLTYSSENFSHVPECGALYYTIENKKITIDYQMRINKPIKVELIKKKCNTRTRYKESKTN